MYTAHPDRYADMPYRRTGRSGLKLPALSLGLWHNFGPDRPVDTQRAILRRAFDLGDHPLRPGQQLRPAARLPPSTPFGEILAPTSRPTATS